MTRKSFIYLFLLFLSFQTGLYAEKVRYVIDGDTFILQDNQRVRMIGINAPETSHRKYHKKGQSFGKEAKYYLEDLIKGKDVDLKSDEEKFDRFGRRLAYVYLKDGTFVNRKMVEDGYAAAYQKFSFQYKKEFTELETRAQAAKRGMWSQKQSSSLNPVNWKAVKRWFKTLQ